MCVRAGGQQRGRQWQRDRGRENKSEINLLGHIIAASMRVVEGLIMVLSKTLNRLSCCTRVWGRVFDQCYPGKFCDNGMRGDGKGLRVEGGALKMPHG